METEKKIFLIKIQSDNNLFHFFKIYLFKKYCLLLFFEVFILLIFDFDFWFILKI
jgi:hypothetical protein